MSSANALPHADCPLCRPQDEIVLWRDARCRVIRVPDADYPGYCRLIWNEHLAEMSDLAPADRLHLLGVLTGIETAVRECFRPDKINLASFGNMVPHLHWHIIARYRDDRHFPQSVWGEPQRDAAPRPAVADAELAAALAGAIAASLGTTMS
ncbi:MAG: HIT family protein [Zoogloea sp.]|nr:HIT family protein [Zoogloea sp.]